MTTLPAGHTLGAYSLFADLDVATREALACDSRVRSYPKGQILCSEGDPGDTLLLLEDGQVTVSRFCSNGLEIVLAEVHAPVAFGELAVIDGLPRTATLTATSDVCVRYIDRLTILALVEREPSVAMAMMRTLTAMVRATNDRLGDLLSLDVPGRLAKWLLAHMEDDCVTLTRSQESLARSLGTTRVSLNRALHQLERLGAIEVQGQCIRLLDDARLRSLSNG